MARRWWGGRWWGAMGCADGEGVMLHTLLDPLHPALLQPQVRHELGDGAPGLFLSRGSVETA